MKKRILIIDDDKDLVEILRHTLEGRGYEITYAYDGREGIMKVKAERPDLIILDIMLPEVDGYKVSRMLKFDIKYKDIPILMFSSRQEGSSQVSSEVGADMFVAKSAGVDEISQRVDAILHKTLPKSLGVTMEYPPSPAAEEAYSIETATIDELKSKIRRLAAINDVVYDMNRAGELNTCVKNFIDKVSEVLAADISSLLLLDRKKDELVLKIAKGIKDEIVKNTRVKMGEGISGLVAKEGKPIFMKDVKDYPHLRTKGGRAYKTDSFISVPIMVDKEVLGVINVTDKKDKSSFTDEDFTTLLSIAKNAASSIKNSLIYDELRTINRIKTDFLITLAHELKSPLINVKSSMDILIKTASSVLGEQHLKFLNIAKTNVERLIRLVEDLLEVSKLETGKTEMKRSRVDIAGLLRNTAESFRALCDKRQVVLAVSLPQDERIIWGDPDKLDQVVHNLLSNAVKFTPDRGRVELVLEDLNDSVRFSVSDNGPGIPEENMPRIFDKFNSLSAGGDKSKQGTGLGLSITKDIVELHKGSIRVEAQPGQGAKFFVELPKDLRKR